MRFLSYTFLLILPLIVACTATDPYTAIESHVLENAQYWQRADASSALYLRGPKAQQTLNQDLARCVVEIRELEGLAAIKKGIPGVPRDPAYPDDNMAPGTRMIDNHAMARNGYLRMEDRPYQDFETCMYAKGWERVAYLPYETADRARQTYIDQVRMNMFGSKNRSHEDYAYDTDNNEKFGLNSD